MRQFFYVNCEHFQVHLIGYILYRIVQFIVQLIGIYLAKLYDILLFYNIQQP